MKRSASAPAPHFDPAHAWRSTLGSARGAAAGVAILLLVAVAFVFRGALDNGLVHYDDDIYLKRIPELHGWSGERVLWMLTDRRWFYWHPLTHAAHAGLISLFGEDLRLHHAASVLLHGLNALWVMVLAAAFLGPRRGETAPARPALVVAAAGAVALLWAVHPLRVESVAWLAEMKDLLCAFLSFAATALWLRRATLPADAPRGRWTAAVYTLFVLALAAKPLAIALPVAWLVLDLFLLDARGRPGGLGAAVLDKVPFLLLGFGAVLAGATGMKEHGRTSDPLELGMGARFLTPLWGFAAPLVRTVWPAGLSPVDPQFPREEITLLSLRWGGSLLLLTAVSVLALREFRAGRRAPAVAWLCYLSLAAPVSGIRQLAALATADRFGYTATLPLWILGGAGLLAVLRSEGSRPRFLSAALLPAALAGMLGALSARQVEVWRDPGTFWNRVLREWPGRGPAPHDHLGSWFVLQAAKSKDGALLVEAEREFRTSLRLHERNPTAHNNLGLVRETLGDPEEAEREYRRAVELGPEFSFARVNLALLLLRTGRLAEAETQYRAAVASGGWVHPNRMARLERGLAAAGEKR